MSRSFPWNRLGIDPTSDAQAVRKAYADALRATNVDDDIAGYAELRRARDYALQLAAQSARAEAAEAEAADADADDDDGAALGLGGLDDDDSGADDWIDDDWDEDDEAAWQAGQSAFNPLGSAGPGGAPATELSESQRAAQAAWNRLLDVLYPDGAVSDDAVSLEELDDGLAAVAALVARAEEADLDEHEALDTALAELFARTWPRSAPFVEPANAAFHWLGEAGVLEERPALRFLNQRLKGMRFHEKVQEPGHPLHKAWAELSRPGRAGFVDRLKVSRLDVHNLLKGIRDRYPELESLLDPERVQSWEGTAARASEGGRNFVGVLLFVLLVFALLRGMMAIVGNVDDLDDARPRILPSQMVGPSAAEIDAEVAKVFGQGTDMAVVRKADTVFADQLRLAARRSADTGELRAFVRNKAVQSGEVGNFEALVALAELKRMWLTAAKGNTAQCRNVMVGDFESLPLTLGAAEAGRETDLLRRLLAARVLSHQASGKARTFSIPGWVVARTIADTGMSDAELTAALRDPEHASRCKVELAMLGVVLKEPGRVSADLLRGL